LSISRRHTIRRRSDSDGRPARETRQERGESVELLSRELGVPLYRLEQWRQKADAALDGALKEREADPASGELAAAMQRIGELSMENELLRSRIERPGPLGRRRSR
jgi:transposase